MFEDNSPKNAAQQQQKRGEEAKISNAAEAATNQYVDDGLSLE